MQKILASKVLEDIEDRVKDRMLYGITFLDDALSGILDDTIVIGGSTGQGKTQLAMTIASNIAVNQKKNAHLYALEASKNEIGMRKIYEYAAKEYFNDLNREYFNISYDRFVRGAIDKRFYKYVDIGKNKAEEDLKYLSVKYRPGVKYTIDDFMKSFKQWECESNIVILDHITFFDSVFSTQTERIKLQEAIKKIRFVTIEHHMPFIVVTHLNRPEKGTKNQRIIPGIDDIFGSSDVAKEATIVIFIAKDFETKPSVKTKIPFLMRVAKFRDNNSIERFVALMNFNLDLNCYDSEYKLARLKDGETKYEILAKEDLPFWAERATNEPGRTIPADRKPYKDF